MADYKVIDAEKLDADLTTVADAIRSKGGTTEKLSFPQGMKQAVEAISSGGGLHMWNGIITQTMNASYMNITHNLGSDKLLILAELIDDTGRQATYQPFRIIGWSPEVLTPHIKYADNNGTEVYADESVGDTTNRVALALLQTGNASATKLTVASQNRNQSNTMVHSNENNHVLWYTGSNIGATTWNVTVIDISNAGISFSE